MIGKTRRPLGHREESDGPEPRTNARTFLFKEDAAVEAEKLQAARWVTYVCFVGAYDRWVIEAKRKSWGYGQPRLLLKDGTVGLVVET